MSLLIIFVILCGAGFILFSKIQLFNSDTLFNKDYKVSVIIPVRNEERNLPHILKTLSKQTYKPYEIIIVDDFSSDKSREIAQKFDIKLIESVELPENWTGKTWALWNGFKQSKGDILVFLDADVRLSKNALNNLLYTRERLGGVISAVPYNYTERFYERFSLIPYLLGVLAFTSPFEKRSKNKGLYGSCIVTTRKDYERVNGHNSISSELLDDLNLGKKFSQAGIKINNFIGFNDVSFRMYPNGLRSEIQGFSKGAVLSTAALSPVTIILIALWVLGLFSVGLITPFLIILKCQLWVLFFLGYIIYMLQIIYFLKFTGYYGKLMPLLHFLSSIFFVFIMFYSLYQIIFVGSVSWKGRQVKVGGRKCR